MAATEVECRFFYRQLVQTLHELQMDEVIHDVEEEWISLDALTVEEALLLEGGDTPLSPTVSPKKQNKQSSPGSPSYMTQALFPLEPDEESQQSPSRKDDRPIEERLYPPQRRVLLLINAIEQALTQLTIQGLASMDMLHQDELLFKNPQRPEQAFTLSRTTLQQHRPNALVLLDSLRALAHYIDPTGEINV